MMFVGYKVSEIDRLRNSKVAKGIKVKKTKHEGDYHFRAVELVTSPFFYYGAALPHPDTRSPTGLIDGFYGRMGSTLPPCTVDKYHLGLKTLTEEWIAWRDIEKVSPEECFDAVAYINDRPIPKWRKDELLKINDEIIDMLARDDKEELLNFKIKLFCKDENYTDFKLPRGIYAREDVAKVFFGPFFSKIEEIIYAQPEFIKHVPVKDRGTYIDNFLKSEGATYIATDYSKFECHFDALRMENCEFVLYRHILGENARGIIALEIMKEVLQGDNQIFARWFSGTITARRMSGEMNTSLGNGFSNLMMMLETCVRVGNDFREMRGVVEGDDGLFRFLDGMVVPQSADFRAAGCDIKLDCYERISDASFCGLLYDETDKMVISDPYKIMCTIGLLSKEYAMARESKKLALLKCKAMSVLHQYPACPVVASMARYILRCTKRIDVRGIVENSRSLSQWDREKYYEALKAKDYDVKLEIGINTRLLFSELYNLDVATQERLEAVFDNKQVLEPFSDAVIDYELCHGVVPGTTKLTRASWVTYFNVYGVDSERVTNATYVHFPIEPFADAA